MFHRCQMKRASLLVFALLLYFATPAFSGAERFPKKGGILNESSKPCAYTQAVEEQSSYFYGKMTGNVGVLTFDDPQCMTSKGIALNVNKMMINNAISRWYSHPDADFRTRVPELSKGNSFQKKGQCIQSKKYPMVSITVDYVVQNDSIIRVLHGTGMVGCSLADVAQ